MSQEVTALLQDCRERRIQLWVEGRKLRFKAPRGALDGELRARIAECRAQLIEALASSPSSPGGSVSSGTQAREGLQRFPLSAAQRRLWFLDALEGRALTYNIAFACVIEGPLQEEDIHHALRHIVQRHPALRTRFGAVDGEPFAEVIPEVTWRPEPLGPNDGRLDEATLIRQVADAAATHHFRLDRAPLLWVRLGRLGPDRFLMATTFHHIVADGWSGGVFLAELRSLLEARLGGGAPRLPALVRQYRDHVADRAEALRGETARNLQRYWCQALDGAPQTIPLPLCKPRGQSRDHRAGLFSFALPAEMCSAVRDLAKDCKGTPFMVLLGAFCAVLRRFGAGDDMVIGTPVAGRDHRDDRDLIGFFADTVALRVDLGGDPAFHTIVDRLRKTALGAFAHAALPFEQVVSAVGAPRSTDHNPIFQVMFAMQSDLMGHYPPSDSLPRITLLPSHPAHAHFDLTLNVYEGEGVYHCGFEYAADLLAESTVEAMGGDFRHLIAALTEAPRKPLSKLVLYSPEKRRLLAEAPNRLFAGRSGQGTAEDVLAAFRDQAARFPEATALETTDTRIDYGDLRRRIAEAAVHLRQAGVGPEVRVGLGLGRVPQQVVAMMAVLEAGGAYVPIDPGYPDARARLIAEDADLGLVLTQAGVAAAHGSLFQAMGFARQAGHPLEALGLDLWQGPASMRSGSDRLGPAQAENVAYVIYTSGTTGTPRGVSITRGGLAAFCRSARSLYGFTPSDRILQFASAGFDAAVEEIFGALTSGATLVLRDEDMIRSAAHFCEATRAHRISVLDLPTAFWHGLAADPSCLLPESVRMVIIGGERAGAEAWRDWCGRHERVALANTYGPTETCVVVTAHLRAPGQTPVAGEVPIGRPASHVRAYILDAALEPVPPGAVGQLYLGGPSLARDYHGRAASTAEAFVPNPFGDRPGSRLYRSGDLVRLDERGRILFLGRMDRQIKLRGFRIEPSEIERRLCEQEAVGQAVVLKHGDADDAYLAAYVRPATARIPADDRALHRIRQALAASLPAFMTPSAFAWVASFPLTSHGKLDERALPPATPLTEPLGAPPQGPLEESLAVIWCALLGIERVGRTDNFFQMGGHSLLVTKLMARIEKTFGKQVAMRDFFLTPTIARLAALVSDSAPSPAAGPIQPLSDRDRLPLSFSQRRLWFLAQVEEAGPAYNISGGFHMEGTLDRDALERTLMFLSERHPALRTRFPDEKGVPYAEVLDKLPTTTVIDLSAPTEAAFEAALQRLLEDEAVHRFDLARGPLFRAFLIRRSDDRHVLLLNLHHIVADGWSIDVFLHEAATCYNAFRDDPGRPAPLQPLALQYADFAAWQAQRLSGDYLRRLTRFWKRKLGDLPEAAPLPTDRLWSDRRDRGGACLAFALPQDVATRLNVLFSNHGATPFMGYLALFQLFLARLMDCRVVVVGTPVAGRHHADLEGLFGFFVNTLVLRTHVSPSHSFLDLLARVRTECIDAFAHGEMPFDLLVEELEVPRSIHRMPLAQVFFAFERESAMPSFGDLTLRPLTGQARHAKFDLDLLIREDAGQTQGLLQYSTDLFEAATIRRFATYFTCLLTAVASEPERSILDQPLWESADMQRQLADWNRTEVAYPRETTLHDAFLEVATREPDRIALEDARTGATTSYGELARCSENLAKWLRLKGLCSGDLVAVAQEPSPQWVTLLLAVIRAGGTYAALDPGTPAVRLADMVRDVSARFFVGGDRGILEGGYLGAEELLEASRCAPSEPVSLPRLDGSWPFCLVFTSGSTGKPKGVLLPHRAMLRLLFNSPFHLMGPGDRATHLYNPAFDVSNLEIFGSLLHGATLVFLPRDIITDPVAMKACLQERRINRADLPTALMDHLVSLDPDVFAGLDSLAFGGQQAESHIVARLLRTHPDLVLFNHYGPSENGVNTTSARLSGTLPDHAAVPIGVPIPNTRVYVVDDDLRPVPPGVPGYLLTGGDGLAYGYLNRPALTAAAFIPDPFSGKSGARLYHTGDRVVLRSDGNLYFLGRRDGQVKIRGFRVETGEIAAVLAGFPGIGQTAVDCRGVGRQAYLAAYFTAREPIDVEALRRHAEQRLPAYMVPSHFVALARLPMTANGKLDRAALPEPEAEDVATQAPLSATGIRLAEIWHRVLGCTCGAETRFFQAGGHSLAAVRVVALVREELGIRLPVRALFDHPRLGALADHLDALRLQTTTAWLPLKAGTRSGGDAPLSSQQERLWFLERLEHAGGAYNVTSVWRVSAALDANRLLASLEAVAQRHDILRTHWPEIEDRPRAVTRARVTLDYVYMDLTALAPDEAEAESRAMCVEAGRRPFRLAHDGPLRLLIVRTDAEAYRVALVIHHIAVDEWSSEILMQDWARLYEDPGADLAPLALQYGDYATWQRRWMQTSEAETQATWWRDHLAGIPSVCDLPLDRPRARTPHVTGADHAFVLPRELRHRVERCAREVQGTPFMVWLAAFAALLERHGAGSDIVIGTPVAQRELPGTQNLIGFFTNSLALRCDLSGDPDFVTLLARARGEVLDAFDHALLPFAEVVRAVQPTRQLAVSPLFQVLLVVLEDAAPAHDAWGGTWTPDPIAGAAAKFDLTLFLQATDGGYAAAFEYNAEIFEATTIVALAERLERLLDQVTRDMRRPLSKLQVLRETDREFLRCHGIGPASPVLAGRSAPVHVADLTERAAQVHPDSIALLDGDRGLSYSQLDQAANALATRLMDFGAEVGRPVALCMKRGAFQMVAVAAILKTGAVCLPLDADQPPARLWCMLDQAQPDLLLHDGSAPVGLMPRQGIRLQLDFETCLEGADGRHSPDVGLTAQHPAYVLFTSGSTGTPKGVVMHHGTLANLVTYQCGQSVPQPRTLQFASLAFDVSFQEIFATWAAGGTLVLPDEDHRRDPHRLLRFLNRHAVARLFLPFVALQSLVDAALEADDPHLPHLRQIITAGEQLQVGPAMRRFFHANPDMRLVNQYGPTETHVATAFALPSNPDDWDALPPIGNPIDGARAYVLDRSMMAVPPGVSGDLYLGGSIPATGYVGRARITAARFLPDPFGETPGSRMYRTGDRARFDGSGRLLFLGRTDFQVKIRGFRVEPGEVEAWLASHRDVAACAVVARETRRGMSLQAHVVPSTPQALDLGALRLWLAERLPDYMVPRHLRCVAELPLTASGKLDRRALPSLQTEVKAAPAHDAQAVRHPTIQIIAGIWCRVLDLPHVDVADHFFELGGHSLLATRVFSAIRHALGLELPIALLFEAPRLKEFAARVMAARTDGLFKAADPLEPRPVAERDRGPLSYAQQRMWFLDDLEQMGTAYLLPLVFYLDGPLDREAFGRAVDALCRRHESLRTRVVKRGGVPQAVVDAPRNGVLTYLDLGDQPDGDTRFQAEARALLRRGFQLDRDQPFRAGLFRLGPTRYGCCLVLHHIAADGWSLGILARELGIFYRGEHPPELSLNYGDFAVWQRRLCRPSRMKTTLLWARERLAHMPPSLDLHGGKPRPKRQSYEGDSLRFSISSERLSGLHRVGREHGTTLFMTLLSLYGLALSHYSGRRTFPVGTPIAGRNRSETETLIGCFINTLVLCLDVRGNPSWREFLARVRREALDVFDRQDLPFELLVDAVQPERDLAFSPIFQVFFALQNTPSIEFDLGEVVPRPIDLADDAAKYDFSLYFTETASALEGIIEYRRDLFSRAYAERFARHFADLVDALLDRPGSPPNRLPATIGAEREALVRWHSEIGSTSAMPLVPCRFASQVGAVPNRTALLTDTGQVLTYAQLDREIEGIVRRLSAGGMGRGDRVLLLMPPCVSLVASIMAAFRLGAAFVPLDPTLPTSRLRWVAEDSGASALLCRSDHPLVHEFSGQVIDLDRPPAGDLPPCPPCPLDARDAAYVIYTSGSTGNPKGVAVEHGSLAHFFEVTGRKLPLGPEDCLLAVTTPSFDISILEMLLPLVNGASVALVEHKRLTEIESVVRWARDIGITVVQGTPATWTMWLAAGWTGTPRLICGGEAMHLDLARKLCARSEQVFNAYGPTEATIWVSALDVADHLAADTDEGAIPLGLPLAGIAHYVVDADMRLQPHGTPGELLIGGPTLARGYVNRPGLTAQRFVPDCFSGERGRRLYRTGDLVVRKPDGTLAFLGRMDHQVKLRGYRIELGEIEACLLDMPEVAQAVVSLVNPPRREAFLQAHLVLKQAGKRTPDCAAYLAQRLPEYMIPARFETHEALPLSPAGKVDRTLLVRQAERSSLGANRAKGAGRPRSVREAMVVDMIAEVLGLEKVGIHDNFFELGGNSIAAMRLIARMRVAWGVEVEVALVFRHPSAAAMSAAALQSEETRIAAPVPRENTALAPLSFAQQRLWFLHLLRDLGDSYHLPSLVRLEGPLDVPALKGALIHLQQRHEALRTAFLADEDGMPMQHIVADPPLPWHELDVSDAGSAECRAFELLAEPFDFTEPGLWRAVLVRLGSDTHLLGLCFHHLIADGWSLNLFTGELVEIYRALRDGAIPSLPDLSLQPADHALWQRAHSAHFERGLAQCCRMLEGAPPMLPLPTDFPYPENGVSSAAQVWLDWDPLLVNRMERVCLDLEVTPYVLLLTAFGLAAGRLAGTEELVIGLPEANRDREEIQPLFGFFANTLALRLDFSGKPDVRTLLRRVKDNLLNALSYRHVPFDRVVEALSPPRVPGREPIFQILFSMEPQSPTVGQWSIPGVRVEDIVRSRTSTPFMMALVLATGAQSYSGMLEYRDDLFRTETASSFKDLFQRTVEALCGAGETALDEALPELPSTWPGRGDAVQGETTIPGPKAPRGAAHQVRLPRDGVELRLCEIWSDLLQRPVTDPFLDFFDLGGHSILAVRMVARLRTTFGRSVPLSEIFTEPTIAALASRLRSTAEAGPSDSVLLLNRSDRDDGEPRPAFFCVPGSGGSALYLHPLASALTEYRCFGLQSPGLDGTREPLTDIEAMAAHHIATMRSIQPEGPYFLGGHSFGGLVAFAMARMLEAQGRSVAGLVILDTALSDPPAVNPLQSEDECDWIAKLLAQTARDTGCRIDLDEARLRRCPEARRFEVVREALVEADLIPPDLDVVAVRSLFRVNAANVQAAKRPDKDPELRAPLFLVKALDGVRQADLEAWGLPPRTTEPDLGWTLYCRRAPLVREVAGDHLGMLSAKHAADTARIVADMLHTAASHVTADRQRKMEKSDMRS
ncbi:Amino acid adenylation domain-containing protein [Sulfidibacter corallicola]|uniref:Amino acid adenylation domain-containing protein n=1 Tax=Sulfidibacter corallicola TaxID=2818388 RepID=A0A8A4TTT4_SULCO|nr:non-ribosomal peptide synthetase [Sulfidibacter corallicola]QTD52528.1 amino acid adenylation domain-containing protein [Sulfidibacter corallicola]